MERITTAVKCLSELYDFGRLIIEKGPDVLLKRESRDTLSRLLKVHKSMDESVPETRINPRDPLTTIANLEKFRMFLNGQLADMKLDLSRTKTLAAWDSDCERVMQRASSFAAGLGGELNKERLEGIRRSVLELEARGNEFMNAKRGSRLPYFVFTDVQRRKRELRSWIDCVSKPAQDRDTARLPDPIRLRSFNGRDSAFDGLKESPPIRLKRNRLTRKRRADK